MCACLHAHVLERKSGSQKFGAAAAEQQRTSRRTGNTPPTTGRCLYRGVCVCIAAAGRFCVAFCRFRPTLAAAPASTHAHTQIHHHILMIAIITSRPPLHSITGTMQTYSRHTAHTHTHTHRARTLCHINNRRSVIGRCANFSHSSSSSSQKQTGNVDDI